MESLHATVVVDRRWQKVVRPQSDGLGALTAWCSTLSGLSVLLCSHLRLRFVALNAMFFFRPLPLTSPLMLFKSASHAQMLDQ